MRSACVKNSSAANFSLILFIHFYLEESVCQKCRITMLYIRFKKSGRLVNSLSLRNQTRSSRIEWRRIQTARWLDGIALSQIFNLFDHSFKDFLLYLFFFFYHIFFPKLRASHRYLFRFLARQCLSLFTCRIDVPVEVLTDCCPFSHSWSNCWTIHESKRIRTKWTDSLLRWFRIERVQDRCLNDDLVPICLLDGSKVFSHR